MAIICERPAEIEDRAVPGHWEGDLIIGANGRSAAGTLLERSTRFVLQLGKDRSALAVEQAMREAITTLLEELMRSVTWDKVERCPTTDPSRSRPACPSTAVILTHPP